MEHPTVFISYAQEDEEHKKWVKELAGRLLSDGIEVTVDQYDLTLGDSCLNLWSSLFPIWIMC